MLRPPRAHSDRSPRSKVAIFLLVSTLCVPFVTSATPDPRAFEGVLLPPPDLSGVVAVPSAFSPNGDGVRDTVEVRFALDKDVTAVRVEVRRSFAPEPDSLVRVLLVTPALAGLDTVGWDGRDSLGSDAPEGGYRFFVIAEDTSGTDIDSTGLVTLDRTAPDTPAFDPLLPPRIERNPLAIAGPATGADTVLVSVNGAAPIRLLVASGRFSASINLTRGSNTLVLQGTDRAGNRSAPSAPVAVLFDPPLGLVVPERFRPGDRFEVNVVSAASGIRIDLFTLDGRQVRTLSVDRTDVAYVLPWDLKDAAGRELGNGPYLVRLRVLRAGGGEERESTAIVVAR